MARLLAIWQALLATPAHELLFALIMSSVGIANSRRSGVHQTQSNTPWLRKRKIYETAIIARLSAELTPARRVSCGISTRARPAMSPLLLCKPAESDSRHWPRTLSFKPAATSSSGSGSCSCRAPRMQREPQVCRWEPNGRHQVTRCCQSLDLTRHGRRCKPVLRYAQRAQPRNSARRAFSSVNACRNAGSRGARPAT